MSIIAMVLAATVVSAPAPANAGIRIDVTQANAWIGSEIDVRTWDRSEISIDQDVRNAKPDDVRAVVTKSGDSTTVTAEYRGERKSMFFGLIHANNGASFRWIVRVPANRRLTIRESNGRIEIDGVTAPIDASTSNGKIAIEGAGPILAAHTSNGSIEASIATLAGGPPQIDLRSSNGGIRLTVPAGFTTRVDAETVNGHTHNPFAGGNGRGSASVKTSNGSIDITPAR